MGNYDRDAPTIVGPSTAIYEFLEFALNNPQKAWAMRIVPGAVSMNEWHTFFSVLANQPGFALEAVNDLAPAATLTRYLPGNDTNAIAANWTDNGGAAVNFGDVDDRRSLAVYARNSTALASNVPRNLAFHANNAGNLAGRRILAVHTGASLMLRTGLANTSSSGRMRGILTDAGVVVGTGPDFTYKATNRFTTKDRLASFPFDPITGLPWLVAGANAYIDAADNNLFGVQVQMKAAALAVRVNEISLEVEHCLENRMWYAYQNYQPEFGWMQQTMTSLLGAFSAATYYWLVISCPWATASSSATLPVMIGAPESPLSTTPGGAGEHRGIYQLTLGWAAGVPKSVPTIQPGFFPALIGNAGTINEQSQAFAQMDRITIWSGAVANIGTQYTTPAGGPHPIAGVQGGIQWAGSSPPDAPLVFELRSGVGAITGGGVLEARATLRPEQTTKPLSFQRIPWDGGSINLAASTQYHLLVLSSATQARGWRVMRGNSRSNETQPTPTTTQTEVEQQTYGGSGTAVGQVDSYVQNGAANDRHDLFLALFRAPDPPINLVATPVAEQTITLADGSVAPVFAPHVAVSWAPPSSPLGANFRAYILQRRRRATPQGEWVTILERRVAATETPASVENTETFFRDFTAGYGVVGREYADGWDYALLVENHLGLRSVLASSVDVQNVVPTADCAGWQVNNREPWANVPLRVLQETRGGGGDPTEQRVVLGAPPIVRVGEEPPPRRYSVSWANLDRDSDRSVRLHRQGALLGIPWAFHHTRGDRIIGVPTMPGSSRESGALTTYDGEIAVGGSEADLIAYYPNLPCEVVLDGSSGFALVPDVGTEFDPGTGDFTFAIHGRIGGSGTSDYYWSKGQLGVGDGYACRTTGVAGVIEHVADGATGAITASFTDASLFGTLHTLFLEGTSGRIDVYVDDEDSARASATGATGSIANALGLIVGGNNNGTDGVTAGTFMACSYRMPGYWPERLGAVQREQFHRYCVAHYDQRAPDGSVFAFDAADSRSWEENRAGLLSLGSSLTRHRMTLAGTWRRRGRPWNLASVDAWI